MPRVVRVFCLRHWVQAFAMMALALSCPTSYAAEKDPLKAAGLVLEEMDQRAPGDWKRTLAWLRFGDALRINGRSEEAVAALNRAAEHNQKVNSDATHDENAAELCRLYALLGNTTQALSIAKTATTQNYEMLGILLATQSLAGETRKAEFETMVRGAITRIKERGLRGNEEQWLRAMVGLSLDLRLDGLAREVLGLIHQPFWRSAALAEFKDRTLAATCPDVPLRVRALVMAGATEAALAAASEIKDGMTRDEALRVAARFCSGPAATLLVKAIADPATRLLARGPFLGPEHFEVSIADLRNSPAADRPLLAEALAVTAGKNGHVGLVHKFAQEIAPGPGRFRALEAAICFLQEGKATGDAVSGLLDEAQTLLMEHQKSFGRDLDRARLELALRLQKAGQGAKSTALLKQVTPSLPLAEVALLAGSPQLARETLSRLVQKKPRGDERDRILTLLIEAGAFEEALAAAARVPLDKTLAKQLFAVRLFEAGRQTEAWSFLEALAPEDRAEALIAISLLRPRNSSLASDSRPRRPEVVAVTSHGSWRPWYPRLERLGISWAAMPFLEPFELGSQGLARKYAAVGFPGGNSHRDHTSATGIEALRGFLDGGGGFVGICAGQFLATHSDFIPMDEVYHPRGDGPHQVEIAKEHPVAQSLPPRMIINRRNGGFLDPGPGCTAIGWYDSEKRYAAAAAADRWDGRVVVISPHPEGSSGFDPRDRLCNNALRWVVWGTP